MGSTDIKTGQTIVALAVVGAMVLIALALIGAAIVTKNWGGLQTVAAIGGSLATALNAPTGIANALGAMTKPKTEEVTKAEGDPNANG